MCRADLKAGWRGIERCKDDPLSEHGLRPDEVLMGGNPNSCDKFFELQRQSPMTKAIIFDLDSCLATPDGMGEQLFAQAFTAIHAANDGSGPEENLRAAFGLETDGHLL